MSEIISLLSSHNLSAILFAIMTMHYLNKS